jgi:hypothetical protein
VSAFEFVFSLFGLLLGFALVEVLGGFVRATRDRHFDVLGFLTPALSVLVVLDLMTFWTVLWSSQAALPANTLSLYVGFFISALYYWAASMIFPAAKAWKGDLDSYYFTVRRKVIAAIIICNLATYAAIWAVKREAPPMTTYLELSLFLVLFAGIVVAQSKRLSGALLSAAVVAYFISALLRA